MTDMAPGEMLARVRAMVEEVVPPAHVVGSLVAPPLGAADGVRQICVVADDEHVRSRGGSAEDAVVRNDDGFVARIFVCSRDDFESKVGLFPDGEKRRLATATLVHDREGELSTLVKRATTLTDELRDVRIKVHYFEVTRLGKRMQSAERRGKTDVLHLLAAQDVLATASVAFLARGEWPAFSATVLTELHGLVPQELVDALARLLAEPSARRARAARGQLDAYLLERGIELVRFPAELWDWMASPAGTEALDYWGGECVRRG
jgi:hypothetical protein